MQPTRSLLSRPLLKAKREVHVEFERAGVILQGV